MGSAFYIVAEREIEGLDTFVNGKFLANCKYLDGLAGEVGVRPLMSFFSMDPEEAESLLDSMNQEETPGGFDPEQWFEAEDGLVTVRGLLSRLEKGPVDLPGDPVPEVLVEFQDFPSIIPAPKQSEVIEDLREFEFVLVRLASEGVRWHMAVDF